MTIKHQNKNISAEKQYVITDVQDNPNGILTFTLSNLYSNATDTLQIDLSKHKLTLTKVTQSELNRLKNSQDEIDIKNRESHIYLVQKNTNDEGVYQEFIWVDNDFEIVGSTDINLEPYFLKENVYNGLDYDQNNNTKALSAYQGYLLNQNKINKSDIVTNLTTDNDNKVLSAKQGKLLQDNKLNKKQTSYKGKNVVVDNNSGEITFEDKPTIPEASTTTPLSDSTNGSTGNSDKWAKADHVHPKSNLYAESVHNHDNTYIKLSDIVTNLTTDNDNKVLSAKQGKLLQDNKLNKNQTSYKGKNVVVDNNSGEITFEDKPTIPEASTTKPLRDSELGTVGISNKWAKEDHVHPKSNLYAESGHNHDNTYIKLSNTTGLVKNDGSIDTTSYLSSLPNHTHKKSEITDFTHTHSISDVTTLQTNLNNKVNTSDIVDNLTTNDTTKVLSAKQGKLLQDNKLNKNQTSYKGKNVVVDNNSGEITFEDKPTIPKAGTIIPFSDSKDGSAGNSDKWAKADHIHRKSNLYAESDHNHDNTYIKLSNTTGLVKNDGTIDTSTYLIKSNFKTIGGNSIVGSGNISLPSKLSDLTNDAGFITSAALNDYAISSHNHNDLYYTKSEVDNMNLGSGSSGEVDLSNYIRKSSTSGLVKNDGSIDTTSYLSSLPNHTHKKSEITDFTHTHNISDVATLQTTLNGKANTSHTHTTSEITDFPVIPDVSNYIQKSSTSGLVKNDGSIDTTNYLSSLPSHTHTKSEITDFTHTHSISDITTLQTTLNEKANKSHTHNEYVTNQELYDNIPIDYVITATDSTSTESVSPFIVGEDYYFTIMAVQTSFIGVTVMSIPINDIRCEIVHSGAVADLTPVKSDENTVTFKFTPTEQKGHILKVYFLGIPVATYTFDAIIDTGWKEVTFKSGYTRYKDSMSVYIRRKGDVVELTGVWKPTSTKSAAANPVAFASIPDELKPTKSINVICAGVGKNTYRLTVEANGELKWSQYGVTTSNDLTENSFCHVRCTWII